MKKRSFDVDLSIKFTQRYDAMDLSCKLQEHIGSYGDTGAGFGWRDVQFSTKNISAARSVEKRSIAFLEKAGLVRTDGEFTVRIIRRTYGPRPGDYEAKHIPS